MSFLHVPLSITWSNGHTWERTLGNAVFILGGHVQGSHRGRGENYCRRPADPASETSQVQLQAQQWACDNPARVVETGLRAWDSPRQETLGPQLTPSSPGALAAISG